jgi:hypothetical protein
MNNPCRMPSPPLPERPLCPVHKVPMNVNRTLGELQYRYCPVPDCNESKRTLRRRPAHEPAKPGPVHAGDGVSDVR